MLLSPHHISSAELMEMPIVESELGRILCPKDRKEWRRWLEGHFETENEIVVAISGKDQDGVIYNDAVEEALCFGWIDSITGHLEGYPYTKRFTPRRKGSPYSRPNIERLIWLDSEGMIHPKVRPSVEGLLSADYEYPEDIIREIREDEDVWKNYQSFSEPYKRIRIAYIDAARKRPEEFRKRLDNFISNTRKNRLIGGYGGVDKYY